MMPPADNKCIINQNTEVLLHNHNQSADAAAFFSAGDNVDKGAGTSGVFSAIAPTAPSSATAINEKLREIQMSLTNLSTTSGGNAINNSDYTVKPSKKPMLAATAAVAVTQMPPPLPTNFQQNFESNPDKQLLQQNQPLCSKNNGMPLSTLTDNNNHVLEPTNSYMQLQHKQKSPDMNYFDPLSAAVGLPPASSTMSSPLKVLKKSFSADNLQHTAELNAKQEFLPTPLHSGSGVTAADPSFLPTSADGFYAVDRNDRSTMMMLAQQHQSQYHGNFNSASFSTNNNGNLPQHLQYYADQSNHANGSALSHQVNQHYALTMNGGRFAYQHSNSVMPPRMHAGNGVGMPHPTGLAMSTSKSGIFVPRNQMPFPGFVTLTAPPTRVTAQSQPSTMAGKNNWQHQNGHVVHHQCHNPRFPAGIPTTQQMPANLTSSWQPSPMCHYPPTTTFPNSTAYSSHYMLQQHQHPQHDASFTQHSHPMHAGPTTMANGQHISAARGYNAIPGQQQQHVGHGPQPSAVHDQQHGGAVNQLLALSSPPSASTFGAAIALFTQQQQAGSNSASGTASTSVNSKKVNSHHGRRRRRIHKHNSSTYSAVSGDAADTPTSSRNDEVGYIPNGRSNGNSASGSDSANDEDDDDDDEDENNTVEDTPEPEDDVEYESRKLIQEAAAMAAHADYADSSQNSAFSAGGSARYVHQRPPHPHGVGQNAPSSTFFNGQTNDDHSALRRQTSISSSKSNSSAGAMQNGNSGSAETAAAAAAAAATAATANNLRDGAAVVMHAAYLGSTHLFCESRVSRATRLAQCQEALTRIKAPDGESQPMIDVDICISIEKVVIVNTDTSHVLMEHALRTISYTADMGDLVVLMVKRGLEDLPQALQPGTATQPKMLCHVFQSQTAPAIAQCVGQAFQVAYVEFLKANGVQDERYLRMLDYQEVLASQEMASDELDAFATKERQKDVIIPKQKQEPLGIAIVESGWGSLVPTVVVANIQPGGAAGRTGKLNIGDQILNVDGVSCVGLPLKRCQQLLKDTRATKLAVKLSVVPTSPVVSVRIRRPDTRYQLGFSVQNGIICSLLRGGIAERGGIRVGHRIIEINGQSVVSTSHEQIVNMLAHSVGDILIKTMPTSIYRLLTGQEQPLYI